MPGFLIQAFSFIKVYNHYHEFVICQYIKSCLTFTNPQYTTNMNKMTNSNYSACVSGLFILPATIMFLQHDRDAAIVSGLIALGFGIVSFILALKKV